MESYIYTFIVLGIISFIEYTVFVIYILRHTRNVDTNCKALDQVQKTFAILTLINYPTRVFNVVFIFVRDDFMYEIMIGIHYLSSMCIFSMIGLCWYGINRLSIYISNLFHKSDEYKRAFLSRAKLLVICADITAIVSCIVIVALDYKPFSVKALDDTKPIFHMQFRVHQLCCIWAIYVYLTVIGCLLLRQISKFYTKKPPLLIFSLCILIASFTLVVTITTCQIFFKDIFTREI
jgi:hypothetical protein